MAKLTIAEVQQKTTKGGKPYLNIKSSTGKWYYCWSDAQYIWHLIVVGATIEPVLATQGNFTSITGIVGLADQSGGVTVATNRETQPTTSTAWERLFARLDKLEAKIDDLAKFMGMAENKPLPPLTDDIDPKKIPF